MNKVTEKWSQHFEHRGPSSSAWFHVARLCQSSDEKYWPYDTYSILLSRFWYEYPDYRSCSWNDLAWGSLVRSADFNRVLSERMGKKNRDGIHLIRYRKKKEYNSVQFKMVSMRSEKSICAPPRLSGVSPTLIIIIYNFCIAEVSEVSPTTPLKRFHFLLIDDDPLSSF